MSTTKDAYAGKILRVDLTAGTLVEEETSVELKTKWIGGRGFGTKLVCDLVDPKTDPLSPANVLAIAAGPLSGIGISTGARCAFVGKGALTNTLSSASVGGTFGIALKRSGYDAVVLCGKSPKPVHSFLLLERSQFLLTQLTCGALKPGRRLQLCTQSMVTQR